MLYYKIKHFQFIIFMFYQLFNLLLILLIKLIIFCYVSSQILYYINFIVNLLNFLFEIEYSLHFYFKSKIDVRLYLSKYDHESDFCLLNYIFYLFYFQMIFMNILEFQKIDCYNLLLFQVFFLIINQYF